MCDIPWKLCEKRLIWQQQTSNVAEKVIVNKNSMAQIRVNKANGKRLMVIYCFKAEVIRMEKQTFANVSFPPKSARFKLYFISTFA